MDTAKVYQDADGNDCTIHQMVKREPDWAANRIQEGEKAIAANAYLQQRLDAAEEESAADRDLMMRLQLAYEAKREALTAAEEAMRVAQGERDSAMDLAQWDANQLRRLLNLCGISSPESTEELLLIAGEKVARAVSAIEACFKGHNEAVDTAVTKALTAANSRVERLREVLSEVSGGLCLAHLALRKGDHADALIHVGQSEIKADLALADDAKEGV